VSNLRIPVYPESAKGLVFDDPKHHLRIYQGDCLDFLSQIPPSSVDLVFPATVVGRPALLPACVEHTKGRVTYEAGEMVSNLHVEELRRHIRMTTQQAMRVASEIIGENRENGELEGILSRNRIAALNRLIRIAKASSESQESRNPES
jgi:hypothetical protein